MGLLVPGRKDDLVKFWDPRTGTALTTLCVSRALPSMHVTRADMTRLAINIIIPYKPSWKVARKRSTRSNCASLRYSLHEGVGRPPWTPKEVCCVFFLLFSLLAKT